MGLGLLKTVGFRRSPELGVDTCHICLQRKKLESGNFFRGGGDWECLQKDGMAEREGGEALGRSGSPSLGHAPEGSGNPSGDVYVGLFIFV